MRTLSLLAVLVIPGFANPLLQYQVPIPWDLIQPAHILPAVQHHLKVAEARRTAYLNAAAPRTWENTIIARDAIGEDLARAFALVAHLQSVNSSPELRKEFNAAQPLVNRFQSALALDTAIYEKVTAYAATPEAKSLTGVRQRYLQVILDEYRRSGVSLPAGKRARVLELRQELSRLSTQFGQNALDSANAFEVYVTDEAQLAGLPASAKQGAAAGAKAKGREGYRFTLQAPSYGPVMAYAENAALREKLYRAQTTIASSGSWDNRPVVAQTLALRRELATLLGYQNFADYQTELRMAKSGQKVKEFLGDLEEKTRPFFAAEEKALRAIAPDLRAWDLAYLTQKLRQEKFAFNPEELRPYFELDRTLTGMFALVQKLYGIRVCERKDLPVWHSQVRAFEIAEASGAPLATFYADFFPRESKRSGAWMNQFLVGENGTPHIGVIVSNITPPNASGKALLLHREVSTLYHEFGHLLHLALAAGPIRRLNGTSVAWDFVELPSQIMENFTWEKDVLKTFAVHHETGEPLPEALFEKMSAARTFAAAAAQMGQLSRGTLDILLHSDYRVDGDFGAPEVYGRQIAQRFSMAKVEPEECPVCNFSHVFSGGYAAGYYSYKWAEVLDADAFTKFKVSGVVSREVGEAFRKTVLSQGNQQPADVLFRNFMGRDPDPASLLRRSGLETKN
jgi:oligopeptidase A